MLVLDDDALQLQLLGEMLAQLGGTPLKVLATQHVSEALESIATQHPDVLFTDIEMPEMSGTDLIHHIDHSHMKVVAMTAHDDSMVPSLRQAGFDACLLKPFSMHTLAATLTQITRQPFAPNDVAPEAETDSTPDFFAPLTALLRAMSRLNATSLHKPLRRWTNIWRFLHLQPATTCLHPATTCQRLNATPPI